MIYLVVLYIVIIYLQINLFSLLIKVHFIITSYFDKKFNAISTLVQVEDYRKKLYDFKDFIGFTDTYSFYNDYYIKKMADLEFKRNEIENGVSPSLALVPKKQGIIARLFSKLRKLFGLSDVYEKVNV